MNDFYKRVVFEEDENYSDSDDGSDTDFDGSLSEGTYDVIPDDGSMVDVDGDMVDNKDCSDSDVWSVTDFGGYISDIDEEDDCDLNMLSVADREMDIYGGRLCQLYPDGAADLRILQDGFVDDHRMDHSHTVTWDPGIADFRTLSVCYDCMCLMTLFRTVMYLAHYRAERIVWTGPAEGSGRSIAWR